MSPSGFTRYVGIDYSGARTAASGLPGLRVYLARASSPANEVSPPPGSGKHWCRRTLARRLVALLSAPEPTLVGIDHAFSFPIRYFEVHGVPRDWSAFLADFRRHWPTDAAGTSVDQIRRGAVGNGAARAGDSRWRRRTDIRAGGAKSAFHFDVPGSVAKSTHAGLPWLLFLRERLGPRVHFWPFDGWSVPPGRSVVLEVYPALWSRAFPRAGRTPDQHDAYAVATWLQQTDLAGGLGAFLQPALSAPERDLGRVEGWILGVR